MNLPDYVPTDSLVLHQPSQVFTFPLSDEDWKDLKTLEYKFLQEESPAGLAAPQIGINKAAIIFAADNPEIKKFRQDFDQAMPKTLWLNPSYKPSGDDVTQDWEACYSIPGMAFLVPRYSRITYEAYDTNGERQSGITQGI